MEYMIEAFHSFLAFQFVWSHERYGRIHRPLSEDVVQLPGFTNNNTKKEEISKTLIIQIDFQCLDSAWMYLMISRNN